MKIIITGAAGMLGSDLLTVLEAERPVGLTRAELDISNIEKTIKTIDSLKPDIVINCAAYTKVDDCESNQEHAYRVNALGARNLAAACQQTDSVLVHISTDYVFNGKASRPYTEYDNTNPITVYGKAKLAGEHYVQTLANKYYIVRTSWLFGANGPNFVKTMLELSKSHKELKVVNDQFGSPTYTLDLAQAIAELIQSPIYGTYHLTNSGSCTWFEFTREIFKIRGIEVKVNPVTTEEFPRPAPRPKYSILDNFCWSLQGKTLIRSYQEALRDYLAKT